MSDEQTPNAAAPVATESAQFDGEEYVQELFNRFNEATSPRSAATENTPQTEDAQLETSGAVETPSAAPAEPPADEVAVWQKRYNDLQSDMDRRVNRGVATVREEFQQQLTQLAQAVIAGRGGPQQPESFAEVANDETKLKQYFDGLVQQGINRALNTDPRVAAGAAVNETAKFQQDHPDWQNYLAIIEPALKWFPVKPGESYYSRLEQAYDFAKDMYTRAAEQAKAQGGANGAKGQPTTPQPPPGRVTGEQRQALLQRAEQYPNERGVSAAVNTKPNIDPYDPRKLRQNIDRMVNAALKNNG